MVKQFYHLLFCELYITKTAGVSNYELETQTIIKDKMQGKQTCMFLDLK